MERMKIIRERTYYLSPASQIILSVDLTGDVVRADLDLAIRTAIRQHARLTSKIVQEENGDCYFEVDPDDDAWEVAIVDRDDDDEDALESLIHEQERQAFDFENGELLRFFVINHKDYSQLVIVAHHLVGDGLALVYLVLDIMLHLSGAGPKTANAPLQQFDLTTLPATVKLPLMLRILCRSMNLQWRRSRHIFRTADYQRMFDHYWEARETGLSTASVAGEQLAQLMAAAGAHRLSLDAILATAFLQAARYENTAAIAVNLRESANEGMGHFSTGVSFQHTFDESRSFWENTASVQQRIDDKLKNDQKKYFMLKFMAILEPTLIDAAYFSAFDGLQDASAARIRDMYGYGGSGKGVSLTNLNRLPIPDRYGPFGIEKLVVIPSLAPNATRVVGAATLGEQMILSMQYPAGGQTERNQQIFAAACACLETIAAEQATEA